MAVIAIVGAGAVIGAVSYDNHSDYSDYDNYEDYDNYSNYSDAAVRRQRRMDETNRKIDSQKHEINTYKSNSINGYLQSSSLKQQSGVNVSVPEVKKDGDSKINGEETTIANHESTPLKVEIKTIDKIINKIDKILKEDE